MPGYELLVFQSTAHDNPLINYVFIASPLRGCPSVSRWQPALGQILWRLPDIRLRHTVQIKPDATASRPAPAGALVPRSPPLASQACPPQPPEPPGTAGGPFVARIRAIALSTRG